jgi:hypothetical protein
MANIDVSELLTDPDFTSSASLIRRLRAVNDYGENVLTESVPETITVVIQPGKGADLERLPESARLHEVISVWYKGVLNCEAQSGYSDVLIWRGLRFQVMACESFLNYGLGYTKALCVLERASV